MYSRDLSDKHRRHRQGALLAERDLLQEERPLQPRRQREGRSRIASGESRNNDWSKGAYMNDVRTEGGGGRAGLPPKADIVSNLSKGGCMNLRTRGEGSKNSENVADVIYGP